MPKCKIQWIDQNGEPTPDDNEAIGEVWRVANTQIHHGRQIHFSESEHFPICAEHALRLPMPHWEFEPYQKEKDK